MSDTAWHYQDGDRAIGPVDAAVIRRRLQARLMPAGTLVWTDGMTDWAAVESTPFAADVPPRPATAAPVSPRHAHGIAESVSSMPAWIIAGLPLGLLLLVALPGSSFIGVIAYIALAIYDTELFKRADRAPSRGYWWMIALGALGAPVYLYLRAKRLGDPTGYFITSIVTAAAFFLLALTTPLTVAT